MKHTIKLLTLAFTLATILTLTGCSGPVTPDKPCTHEHTKTDVVKEATCIEDGLEQTICVDCEEVIEEQVEIDAGTDTVSVQGFLETKSTITVFVTYPDVEKV